MDKVSLTQDSDAEPWMAIFLEFGRFKPIDLGQFGLFGGLKSIK